MPCSTMIISLPRKVKPLNSKIQSIVSYRTRSWTCWWGFLPDFLWWKLFLPNKKQMRQNFNRKCTKGDLDLTRSLHKQILAGVKMLSSTCYYFSGLCHCWVWSFLLSSRYTVRAENLWQKQEDLREHCWLQCEYVSQRRKSRPRVDKQFE